MNVSADPGGRCELPRGMANLDERLTLNKDSADGERWLPAVGYEGYYEVSNHGNVRSLDRYIAAPQSGGQRKIPGRIMKPLLNGTGWMVAVHVLVLTAFRGDRPPGMNGCHNDGDNRNNHVTNLRWDTQSGNMFDRRRHGTDHEVNKLACPRNHLLKEPNLVPSSLAKGKRGCLACSRGRAQVAEARLRGRVIDLKQAADDHYARIMKRVA